MLRSVSCIAKEKFSKCQKALFLPCKKKCFAASVDDTEVIVKSARLVGYKKCDNKLFK